MGSLLGAQQRAELSTGFDFGALGSRIEQYGVQDAEELKKMTARLKELLERGEGLPKGELASYGEVLQRNGWVLGPVVEVVLRFLTAR